MGAIGKPSQFVGYWGRGDRIETLRRLVPDYYIRQGKLSEVDESVEWAIASASVLTAEFGDASAIAQQHGFTITGLHFYRGTGTNATSAFTQAIDRVIAIAQRLLDWRSLDFGGGGYSYRSGAAFDWSEFGAAIGQKLAALSRPIELLIEPILFG